MKDYLEMIPLIFLLGWFVTQMSNEAILILKKLKWLDYVCQKCITMWLGIIMTVPFFDLKSAVLMSLSAALFAEIYTNNN